uniref:Ig-like domain-containing protein n=1 Tax=Cyprinus carpio TaxID=7962 RepID=A0A8C2BZJ8_CYPCA
MLIFFCLSLWSGVFGDVAVKSVSVMEGESVTLNIDVNTVKTVETDDQIQWRFRPNILIALIYRQSGKRRVIDDVLDGRFRGRLELDQTGSLTITDTRTTVSGLYEVMNTNNKLYTFNLTVYARLSVPVISLSSQNVSSSQQNCSLLCSVVNVSAVSVSWFRGHSLLSSISASDLSISLSLPLEVEYQDNSTYSCVLNNSFTNQTAHLDIRGLCHTCPDHICSCGFTEAVIRLVLSALVGVAAVAVLVYDIRSRSLQQKREQTSSSSSD